MYFLTKYSYEERLEVVSRIIDEGMSMHESARILPTAYTVVNRWAARHMKKRTCSVLGRRLRNMSCNPFYIKLYL